MSARVVNLVAKLLAPLERRVRLAVSRAVVALVDDERKLQTLQVKLLADEVRDRVEHFQPFGFTSRPLAGAEGVFLSVGGSREHGVVVVVDDRRHRPAGALEEGESGLYIAGGKLLVACKADERVLLGLAPTEPVALAPAVDEELEAVKSDIESLRSWIMSATFVVTGVVEGTAVTGTASGPSPAPPAPHSPASVAAEKTFAR